MSSDIYELNCPFCDKLYKLPREKVIKHVGKSIHCRKCGQPFSIPALPPDDSIELSPVPEEFFSEQPPPTMEPLIAHEPEPTAAIQPAPLVEHTSEDASDAEHVATEQPPEEAAFPEEVAAERFAPEPVDTEVPAVESSEEYSVHTPFAGGDALEPPALDEYSDAPIAQSAGEPAAEDSSPHEKEFLSEPTAEAVVEAPESASYFASENLVETAIPLAHEEPPPTIAFSDEEPAEETAAAAPLEAIDTETPVESTPHDPSHGVSLVGEAAEMPALPSEIDFASDLPETFLTEPEPLEAPPPQLPPVPAFVPPPPKPRRGARTAVAPVFDAESEEPQPRRRGRFSSSSEPVPPIKAVPEASLSVDEVPARKEPVIEAEVPLPEPLTDQAEVDTVDSDPMDNDRADSDPAEGDPAVVPREDSSIPVSAPFMQNQISPEIVEHLSGIRRTLVLLATMSMVIAIVLVAILLTVLGIIPKK